MKIITVTIVGALIFALSGCANNNYGITKGTTGAGVGAAGGAILGQAIGHDTEATLLGAAIGTVLGYIVGNEMDKMDRMQLNQVYETAPSGQPVSWTNPDTGNNYQVVAQPAYSNPQNQQAPCRKAEILATIDGQAQKTYTTACRNSRGEWVVRN